ncbi:peptidase-like protein [Microseira wollei NIES-4236]|uniref:Peptidase-like protein n=1 Tax=Microseira wollei NIES-4236 TaxID=2530354 RepID=A0AAV3X7T7_9CYAN|nr:peptidase-like protein [Microseira wollei NIES-4236]
MNFCLKNVRETEVSRGYPGINTRGFRELLYNAVASTQSDPAEQLFLQVNRLYRSGQFKEATPLAEQLVALRRRQVGNAHPKVVQNLGNLAILYASQGRYDEAEQLLEEALAIDRRLGRENLSNSASFSNLALLYESLGRYSEAEKLHKEALDVRRSQFGEEHPRVAQSLGNLANSYLLQGRYNEAEPLYQAALDLYRRLDRAALEGYRRYERTRIIRSRPSNNEGDRISPNVAFASNKLAQLYYFQGRYNEAEPLYREALAAFRSRLGREHPDVANVLNNLALLLHAQGRYAEAEPLYKEALAIDRQQRGNEHPNLASTANHLATLYAARNRTDTALDSLNQGLSIEEVNLSNLLITGSERQKRQYLGTIADSLDLALSLHLQAAPNNSEAANLAFTTLLRRKGRILDAVADNMQILRQNLTPENRQLLDRLSTKRSELAAAIFNPPPDIADASYLKLAGR